MKLEFEITKITILRNPSFMDTIVLHTKHPSTVPHVTDQCLTLQFHAQKDCGIYYIENNFGIHHSSSLIEVINQ